MNKVIPLLFSSWLSAGCSSFPYQPKNFSYNEQQQDPATQRNKVLLIGIDGLRPDALQKARTPALDSLLANGGYSFDAQAGAHTWSGPSWSNIFTGVWENKHGVTDNTLENAKYYTFPSLCTRLNDLKPQLEIETFVSWRPLYERIIGKPDLSYYHPYTDNGDAIITQAAVDALKNNNPDLIFVYFLDVDVAGHTYGFDPQVKEYLTEIEDVDLQISEVLSALTSRPTYEAENWLILVTTDHGGREFTHGGQTPEEKTIFYIASGASARKGELIPPPLQVDIAPTIYYHLGIPVKKEWGLDGQKRGVKSYPRRF